MAPTLQLEITPEEILQQLMRILSSNEFRRAETLGRMLHYIVEQTMAGDVANLKEYFIGVEVFERRRDFDPKDFALVRVQAVRLRRKLDRYYEDAGSLDPIGVAVPKGGYLARFARRTSQIVPSSVVVRTSLSEL